MKSTYTIKYKTKTRIYFIKYSLLNNNKISINWFSK